MTRAVHFKKGTEVKLSLKGPQVIRGGDSNQKTGGPKKKQTWMREWKKVGRKSGGVSQKHNREASNNRSRSVSSARKREQGRSRRHKEGGGKF